MEAYTLDALFRRQEVIDDFESLIWAERYQDNGDFQMDIQSTTQNRTLLREGTNLAMNLSHHVMQIETVEDVLDAQGRKMLKVKGQSMESIMKDRVAKESLNDLTASPKWVLTGTPAEVARKIFRDICITGILDPHDVIPFVREGTFLPTNTISEPVDPITKELEPTSVYEAIVDICKTWNLGFRLIREYDTSKLYFEVYTGSDRTTGQGILPPVIFSPEFDNLENVTELKTIENAKNVAYVYSPVGFLKVYPAEVDPEELTGFDRRVLVVNASDITEDTEDIPAALLQRGREELAQHRTVHSMDGEISNFGMYRYGRDYNLGDVVEMRNDDGVTNNMRVTEQIFVQDQEGERSYPTLTVNVLINTGSWLSWMNNRVWAELGEDEFWANQP